MTDLLHHLIMSAAERYGDRTALSDSGRQQNYAELASTVRQVSSGLASAGMTRFTRVAVFLPKSLETVAAVFAVAMRGGIFVPVNPLLKAQQVVHILNDSGARILITSADRLLAIQRELQGCPELKVLVTVDGLPAAAFPAHTVLRLDELIAEAQLPEEIVAIDDDAASIFYTSGSTGRPKGVVLSHRNMVAGAKSVASYLKNTCDDSLLAVLPFSFDYGFSQLTTAFHAGARVVLLNYLLPTDVLRAAAREEITGLAGVPPLWIQLAGLEWPQKVRDRLRYVTNSGGKLPVSTIKRLRQQVPHTKIYLMYGLTEAFRSTYLPPELVDTRPTSMGKAIPNAEVLVVRPDGTECEADEPGELVHRGALVAKGYWCDEEKTRERFRPGPGRLPGLPLPEVAVWSGDMVRRDKDGFLYFVGRNDELIKTSGYRVSPTEIEEAIYATHMTSAAVVFGVSHPGLGQAIVAVVEPASEDGQDTERLLDSCRKSLPSFMVPATIIWQADLPRNANGKLDRSGIIQHFRPGLEQADVED